MKKIVVNGVGVRKVKPDFIKVVINHEIHGKSYKNVVEDLNAKYGVLQKYIAKERFEPKNLKTVTYNINNEYRYEDGKNINSGYVAHQVMEYELENDFLVLDNFLNALHESMTYASYSVSYHLKDNRKAKAEAYALAVENAKYQASLLTALTKKKLMDIIKIEVNDQDIHQPMMLAARQTMTEFEPKDIEVRASVVIEWEIE